MFVGTLCSRTPFTVKNFETKCEGLSPALFLFAISGNSTYALSICFASMKMKYLLANAPWLAGSAIVMSLGNLIDAVVCLLICRERIDHIP